MECLGIHVFSISHCSNSALNYHKRPPPNDCLKKSRQKSDGLPSQEKLGPI